MGFEAPPVGHPAIRRALSAIAKRGQFVPRQKMFIPRCVPLRPPNGLHSDLCCRSFVSNMIAAVRHGKEDRNYAMLWLVTYSFLLRMPSEVGTFPPSHIACCFRALAGFAIMQVHTRFAIGNGRADDHLEGWGHSLPAIASEKESRAGQWRVEARLYLQGRPVDVHGPYVLGPVHRTLAGGFAPMGIRLGEHCSYETAQNPGGAQSPWP